MSKVKLVVIGKNGCMPCKVLNNQIENRIDELKEIGGEYEYINLDGLEDKDTFIAAHKLMSTPTVWIQSNGEKKYQHKGYADVDTLFELLEDEIKGDK